jgi:hypothetical protein
MRPYIKNLTDYLIGKHHFDAIYIQIPNRDNFLNHVRLSLEAAEVKLWKPETLGKILCQFEIGDVIASKTELAQKLYFAGDCEDMLRGMVAICLSYVIRDRLDPARMPGVPPYPPVADALL